MLSFGSDDGTWTPFDVWVGFVPVWPRTCVAARRVAAKSCIDFILGRCVTDRRMGGGCSGPELDRKEILGRGRRDRVGRAERPNAF